ncbi:MAG: prepilin peptidase [Polymorphobacter sp.]|uniref:A24 family peptidase n=1 Tax=Polymorphobacter sp. TaxID=1909290 RepID=UPI003A86CBD5
MTPLVDLGPEVPLWLAAGALACALVAAGWDMVKFEIPDEISIVLIALAAAYGLVTPGFDWLSHAGAPVLVFAVGLFLFARGWMGGGDIKLLTALASWTGLAGLPLLLVGTALVGGGLALVLLVARRFNAAGQGPRVLHRGAPLPYAVAILGGVLFFAWQAWRVWPLG